MNQSGSSFELAMAEGKPTSSDQLWYWQLPGGDPHGPVRSSDLVVLARAGILTEAHLVRRGHGGAWHRASSVKGLAIAATKPESTSAPPLVAVLARSSSIQPWHLGAVSAVALVCAVLIHQALTKGGPETAAVADSSETAEVSVTTKPLPVVPTEGSGGWQKRATLLSAAPSSTSEPAGQYLGTVVKSTAPIAAVAS